MPDKTKHRQCKNCGLFEDDPAVKDCARCGKRLYVVTDPDNPPAAQATAQTQAEAESTDRTAGTG